MKKVKKLSHNEKRKLAAAANKNFKLVSGWSTDRNSMQSDGIIELFENSTLVRNIVANNGRDGHKQDTSAMQIKDENNPPGNIVGLVTIMRKSIDSSDITGNRKRGVDLKHIQEYSSKKAVINTKLK